MSAAPVYVGDPSPGIQPSPINEVALELARNAQHLTPEAQNALALYIEEMSKPIIASVQIPEPIMMPKDSEK